MPDKYEQLYVANYGTASEPGTVVASDWTAYTETATPVAPVAGQLSPANVISDSSAGSPSTSVLLYDPLNLYVLQEWEESSNVDMWWDAPVMVGATHVAGFRRSGTDTTPFTPSPELEHFRVPVNTRYYSDVGALAGNYVYQVFPLVES